MAMIDAAPSQRDDSRSSSTSGRGRARLAACLAVGLGALTVGTPDAGAAVVAIDLTSLGTGTARVDVTGDNGGLAATGDRTTVVDWLGVGTGSLRIWNGYSSGWGMDGQYGSDSATMLEFASSAGSPTPPVSPVNFAAGAGIQEDPSWVFSGDPYQSAFRSGAVASADFGAGSSMGFRFGSGSNWYYGYLEVTWTASTNTFRILSGAYESTVNTAILAGATPVPAPSALVLLVLGGGASRRARARAA
jgi:hypothetical protein